MAGIGRPLGSYPSSFSCDCKFSVSILPSFAVGIRHLSTGDNIRDIGRNCPTLSLSSAIAWSASYRVRLIKVEMYGAARKGGIIDMGGHLFNRSHGFAIKAREGEGTEDCCGAAEEARERSESEQCVNGRASIFLWRREEVRRHTIKKEMSCKRGLPRRNAFRMGEMMLGRADEQ
jgi:hypothetical protein